MASLFQRVEPLTKDAVFFQRASSAASDSRAELLCADGLRGSIRCARRESVFSRSDMVSSLSIRSSVHRTQLSLSMCLIPSPSVSDIDQF